ncbi:MAG: hypothetical protein IKS00_04610 [Bacteroidales bacterium]|nr:hypothetical protein [Bacteroidales bacterium]
MMFEGFSSKIPPKSRPEWSKLVTGEIQHEFRNYVLQVRIYQIRKDIQMGRSTLESSIDCLYELCMKYSLAVHADIKEIFKQW